MALYVYADETIFTIDKSNNHSALGCGALISKSPITQSVIDNALIALKNDPDFENKRDNRTLTRKYFHASDDSKNAHSHICTSINQSIKGIFEFSYIDTIEEEKLHQRKFVENIFSRCLNHSTLEIFNSTEEVFFTIEKRDTLNTDSTSSWLNNLYKLYEGSTHNIPSFKTYFPKINIELKSKTDPGLQVIDFLIWSANRTKMKVTDDKWHSRIKYTTWHHYRDIDNYTRGQYYLNITPEYDSKTEDYPFPFEKPKEWNLFLNAYVNIEKILIALDKSDFTLQSIHLYEKVELISSKLKTKEYHLTGNDLEIIGGIFLRLFDTVPLYKHANDNKELWIYLFHAKYLASMLVRNDKMHFGRTKDAIERWRYKMKTEKEDEFIKLISG